MLSVTEARQRLLQALAVCGVETIATRGGHGRVLAEEIRANSDYPRFDNSSMDGFAVRAADVTGASQHAPVALAVIGEAPAGAVFAGQVGARQAVRIMTGGALPAGADAVVPVEDTDAPGAQPGAELPPQVLVKRALKPGDFVRPKGQDYRQGDALLAPGRRLRPADLALVAMLGIAELRVHRKPKVAVFSSGNELVEVGGPLGPGAIYETNSYALAALIESCGAEAILLGIAGDTLEDVTAHLERAAESGADLILTSAGVSVGAYDYLREAVSRNGTLDFWKVNMRPGKPFTFGNYRGTAYIGLPGNPASAFVGFEVFVRPALEKMAGVRGWQRRCERMRIGEDVRSDGRESFLRVQIKDQGDERVALLTGHQGSGNLYSLVQAEGLMIVPAGVTEISAGSLVDVWTL